jgi:hypothetical protein
VQPQVEAGSKHPRKNGGVASFPQEMDEFGGLLIQDDAPQPHGNFGRGKEAFIGHNNSIDARIVFEQIGLNTGAEHIYRAVREGIMTHNLIDSAQPHRNGVADALIHRNQKTGGIRFLVQVWRNSAS